MANTLETADLTGGQASDDSLRASRIVSKTSGTRDSLDLDSLKGLKMDLSFFRPNSHLFRFMKEDAFKPVS